MSSVVPPSVRELMNFGNGDWVKPATDSYIAVCNPATGELLAKVPDTTLDDVDAIVRSASEAFPAWRRTPPEERIQYLFKLKNILEQHFEVPRSFS